MLIVRINPCRMLEQQCPCQMWQKKGVFLMIRNRSVLFFLMFLLPPVMGESAAAFPLERELPFPTEKCGETIHNESFSVSTTPIASLEGEPSAMVHDAVNVITGHYSEVQTDLVVPGAEPIRMERYYNSSNRLKGSLEYVWDFNHYGFIRVKSGAKHYYAVYDQGVGAKTAYSGYKDDDKEWTLTLPSETIEKGLTNCASGTISGQTNLKNSFLYLRGGDGKKEVCHLTFGSGMQRQFLRRGHHKYDLERELRPSGNQILHSYDPKEHNHLTQISAVNAKEQPMGDVRISRSKSCFNKDLSISMTANNGQTLTYVFETKKILKDGKENKVNFLKEVERPDGVKERYAYEKASDSYRRVVRRERPKNRFLEISYYRSGKNDVGGETVKVSKDEDLIWRKVKMLSAPVGSDASSIPIFRFFYEKTKNDQNEKMYRTRVYDALNHKTVYEHSKDERLTAIHKYSGTEKHTPYCTERLFWGKKETPNCGNLVARSIEDASGKVHFCRVLEYDLSGNVTQTHLYGNLSGHHDIPIVLDEDGFPIQTGHQEAPESYVKHYTYSNDGLNLVLSEMDDKKKMTYTYLPNTHLLTGKLTWSEGMIQIREFYDYDENGVMILKTVDDGGTPDPQNLTGVTERRLQRIRPTSGNLVGLPEVVEESFINMETSREVPLKKTVHTYTKEGWLQSQTVYDSCGQQRYTQHWKYNKQGNIIRKEDPLGQVTEYRYDENNNRIYERGPRVDYHRELTYDYANRLISEEDIRTDGTRLVTRHHYDYVGNRTQTIDHYGNATTFDYDAFGRIIKTVSPAVCDEKGSSITPTTTTKYNVMSHPTVQTDPLGHETRVCYTIRGKPSRISHPDGSEESYHYNLDGTLHRHTAKNGSITTYTYDYLNRIIKTEVHSANGELFTSSSATYSAFHLLSETDGEGNVTHYSYDGAGRLLSLSKGPKKTTYVYDTLGRRIQTRTFFGDNPHSCTIQAQWYDLLDRVIEETVQNSNGHLFSRVSYSYDEVGNRCEEIHPCESGEAIASKTFDPHHQLTQHTDPEGHSTITTYRYDYQNAQGHYVPYSEETDPLGNITITIKDPLGRLVTHLRKNPFGEVTQLREYRYDAAGNRTQCRESVIDPSRNTHEVIQEWTYNASGQPTSISRASGTPEQQTTHYTYNTHGEKEKIIKPDGTKIHHTYDAMGRLSELRSSDLTVHYTYQYNANHQPTLITDHVTNTKTERTYDYDGNLLSETLGNGLTLNYTYDHAGRPIELELPDTSKIAYGYDAAHLREVRRIDQTGQCRYIHHYTRYDLDNHLLEARMSMGAGFIHHHYDSLGRRVNTQTTHWKENLRSFDAAGNLIEKELTDAAGTLTQHYTYDDLYQLTEETGDTPHSYTYDSLYNRTGTGRTSNTHNSLNQLLKATTHTYTYDKNGNLIERLGPKGLHRFTYDALDRLVMVENDMGWRFRYTYDAFHRRLSKELFISKDKDDTPLCFFYQGQNEIGSCKKDGKILDLRLLGICDRAEIGAAVAFEIDDNVLIPVHNHCGHVSALLTLQGELVETTRYTAYGESTTTNISHPKITQASSPWRFSSKWYDHESGFYYFGRRYYDPSMGRWITQDPLGDKGGPNLYAYALNSPLTHFDTYGLFSQKWKRTLKYCLLPIAINLTGQALQIIGDHFIPIPYVRDAISLTGQLLTGSSPWNYTPYSQQLSSGTYHLGVPERVRNVRCLSVNGVLNSLSSATATAQLISKFHGHNNVHYTYNASHGFLTDIFETIAQKLGIRTNSVDKLTAHIRKLISDIGGAQSGGQILLYAHSQGGQITANALSKLSALEQKMLYVTTFGSAKIITGNHLGGIVNYVNMRDGVPLISDPLGFLQSITTPSSRNVRFLKSNTLPLVDHPIQSTGYLQALQSHGQHFTNTFL